jgi:DNA-binding transcriptional regulator GbsR (MarR family)
MNLSPAVQKYVLHWGEMGTRWGTNRTVAQIQALLYLSPTPVKMTHVLGDRRDYFESIYDVWDLFRAIIEQRKQRELNPTLSMLRTCAAEVDSEEQTDEVTKERIRNMLKFFESTSDWYEQIQELPTPTLQKIMKLGRGITKLIS